ncbi:MAG: hypothetical protein HYY16_19570 [Planctomycetes bacterium]|nr:hypothetical protein [Planctomycetota bacterium]
MPARREAPSILPAESAKPPVTRTSTTRTPSSLSLQGQDAVLADLVRALQNGDEALALECLKGWTDVPALDPDMAAFLRQACLEPYSSELRTRLLFFLYESDEEALRGTVTALLQSESDLNMRSAALQIAAYLSGDDMSEIVRGMVSDPQPRIRADATAALAAMHPRTPDRERLVLQSLDQEKDPVARQQIVIAAGSLDDPQVPEIMWGVLRNPAEAPDVAVEALRLLRPEGEDTGGFLARLGTVLAELRAQSASAELVQAVETKLRFPELGFPLRHGSGCGPEPEGN